MFQCQLAFSLKISILKYICQNQCPYFSFRLFHGFGQFRESVYPHGDEMSSQLELSDVHEGPVLGAVHLAGGVGYCKGGRQTIRGKPKQVNMGLKYGYWDCEIQQEYTCNTYSGSTHSSCL